MKPYRIWNLSIINIMQRLNLLNIMNSFAIFLEWLTNTHNLPFAGFTRRWPLLIYQWKHFIIWKVSIVNIVQMRLLNAHLKEEHQLCVHQQLVFLCVFHHASQTLRLNLLNIMNSLVIFLECLTKKYNIPFVGFHDDDHYLTNDWHLAEFDRFRSLTSCEG